MCLPSPKMPDMSAQIKAQQDALKEQRESDLLAQRDSEMKQAAAEAKRQQRRRRGRASLITRAGASGSLGILDDATPSYTGLKPLGSGTTIS